MFRVGILIFSLIALSTSIANADTTGALNGRIVDVSTQRPLANVTVVVISPTANRTTHTNARGEFSFLDLPPDTYRVSFSLRLYFTNALSALAIHAGEESHLIVALKRQFWILDGCCGRPVGWLIRPGMGADIYEIGNAATTVTGVNGAIWSVLRFVPGVQIAPALRALP